MFLYREVAGEWKGIEYFKEIVGICDVRMWGLDNQLEMRVNIWRNTLSGIIEIDRTRIVVGFVDFGGR